MKSSHKRIQTNIEALTPKRMGSFEVVETLQERRENLVKRSKVITKKLLSFPKKSNERKLLGLELLAVNLEINKLPRQNLQGIENYYIEIVKERVGEVQHKLYMKLAKERMEGIKRTLIFQKGSVE